MPRIKVAIGVAAYNAPYYSDEIDEALRRTAAEQPKLVRAIGSCGLGESPDDARERAFAAQVAIAHDAGLRLIVDANGAHALHVSALRDEAFPFERVLVRAFDGSPDDLALWAQAGAYVSFSAYAAEDPAELNRLAGMLDPRRVLVESGAPEQSFDLLAGYPARCDQVVFVADAMRTTVAATQLAANADEFYR